jgi:hypothetical protein
MSKACKDITAVCFLKENLTVQSHYSNWQGSFMQPAREPGVSGGRVPACCTVKHTHMTAAGPSTPHHAHRITMQQSHKSTGIITWIAMHAPASKVLLTTCTGSAGPW